VANNRPVHRVLHVLDIEKLFSELSGARTELEHALRINEAALGPDHPKVHVIRTNLNALQ
jgi:hypothetical protein